MKYPNSAELCMLARSHLHHTTFLIILKQTKSQLWKDDDCGEIENATLKARNRSVRGMDRAGLKRSFDVPDISQVWIQYFAVLACSKCYPSKILPLLMAKYCDPIFDSANVVFL